MNHRSRWNQRFTSKDEGLILNLMFIRCSSATQSFLKQRELINDIITRLIASEDVGGNADPLFFDRSVAISPTFLLWTPSSSPDLLLQAAPTCPPGHTRAT